MSSTNLAVTLAHAIAFLTEPLLAQHPAAQIIKLQALLEANLTALYAPTWSSKEPLRGSTRRCLALSPACLPPRPIYAACIAAGVQWFDWIDALGNFEFEFYVDPGCVAIRAAGKLTTVWAGSVAAPPLPTPRTGLASFSDAQNRLCAHKTVAQQLLEEDDEDEKILNLINETNWGPTAVTFPRSSSPLSSGDSSPYSRCSSRSSNSSSSDASSSSPSSACSSLSKGSSSSRRAKAAGQRVFVDATKTDVTPYDGGKTTVLTGGVMLGGGPKKTHKPKQHSTGSWRSASRA